jgi:hypothetical protein
VLSGTAEAEDAGGAASAGGWGAALEALAGAAVLLSGSLGRQAVERARAPIERDIKREAVKGLGMRIEGSPATASSAGKVLPADPVVIEQEAGQARLA